MLGLILFALQAPSADLPQFPDSLQIGGRLMSDFHFGSGGDSAEVRRARIRVSGELAPDLSFLTEYDFASSGDLKEMSLRYQQGRDRFRAGYFRQPFGLENATSSNFHSFMEESPMSSALGTSRAAGLGWRRAEQGTALQMGVYRSLSPRIGASPDQAWSLNTRAVWRPVIQLAQNKLLHVGAAINLAFPDDPVVFDARPGIHTAPTFVSSGLVDASQLLRLALEMAWIQGPWHGSAEWMHLAADLETGGSESFHGWALASGYFLTGEGRGYSTSGSTFARTDATNAWEITARISDLDLSASAGAAGQILSSAVGVNFYVNPNTRIILDWTRADVATQNPVDFISLRFAVDW